MIFPHMRFLLPLSLFCVRGHGAAQSSTAKARSQTVTERSIGNEGAYYSGRYPNLFNDRGHTSAEIRSKIAAAYAQLFETGDATTQRLYFIAGSNGDGPLAYILNPGDGDVRTEGMSYAMMIAVQLDHKKEFDSVWNWARTYMYEADPAMPAQGYYAWACKPDGTHLSDTPSPDGEEYFAMALYFAAARWHSGKGIYDYRSRADELLRTMLHKKQSAGPTPFGPKDIGPEFSAATHLPVFLAEPEGRTFSDPSYVLPGFYELWARWGPAEDRAFWEEAARAGRAFFARAANQNTGLTPVYANFDGSPHATTFTESAVFGHDAFRTAGNWSWDWSWFRRDPTESVLSDRVQTFFAAQGAGYADGYTLAGKPLTQYSSSGLIAANAVTALAASPGPRSNAFVEALWNEPIPSGKWRYYDGLLYLLSFLHVSGEFRIWKPAL